MSFKYYSTLLIVLVCLGFPSEAFGQYLRKETVNAKDYAIIYSEGLAGAAKWEAGMKMTRNGATIRHRVSKGNGGNPSINDKIPMRFIVAPEDVANVTWMQAGGVTGGNGNLNADFTTTNTGTGCNGYNYGSRKWRVPTQRELQLMWLFRAPIGIIYPSGAMENVSTKNYWASTEQDADNAWIVDFKQDVPHCFWQPKTNTANVRCVSDY